MTTAPTPPVPLREALRRLRTGRWEGVGEREALLTVVCAAESLKARDVAELAFRPERVVRDCAAEVLRSQPAAEVTAEFVALARTAPEAAVRAAAVVLGAVGSGAAVDQLDGVLAAGGDADRAAARRLLLALPPSPRVRDSLWRLVETGIGDERRAAAARLAGTWLDEDRRRWRELAGDPEPVIREIAVGALADHGGEEGVEELIEGLVSGGAATRQRVRVALEKVASAGNAKLEELLLELLGSGEVGVRTTAVELLLMLPDPAVTVRRILLHLRSLAGWVRERAVDALADCGKAVLEPVIACLGDDDEVVRSAAITIAASFDDPRVVPALLERTGDPDWWVRVTAAEALGRIGHPAAVDGLVALLDDSEARWAAVEALGKIGDVRALPALARLFKDPSIDIRIEVLLALQNFDHPRIMEALRRVASADPARVVRTRALEIAEAIAQRNRENLDNAEDLRTSALRAEPAEDEAPLDLLLIEARNRGASDLHLAVGRPPTLRLAAELVPLDGPPLGPAETVALIDPVLDDRRREQLASGRTLDFCQWVPRGGRYRGNVFRDRLGLNAVFRVVPDHLPGLQQIGLPSHIGEIVDHHQGLFLVAGAAGSGKTTTLAALVNLFNEARSAHVITLEDPVEFVHPFKSCLINQRELGTHMTSFARGLRAALREDPDVIVIGDLRDAETVSLALTAAETGHVVLATLNATTAARAVERLVDGFPSDRQNQVRTVLAETLRMVIAQRLLPSQTEARRVACFEILKVTRAVATMIREGRPEQLRSAIQIGRASGMQSFDDALRELLTRGLITPEVAWHAAGTKSEFEALVPPDFHEDG